MHCDMFIGCYKKRTSTETAVSPPPEKPHYYRPIKKFFHNYSHGMPVLWRIACGPVTLSAAVYPH